MKQGKPPLGLHGNAGNTHAAKGDLTMDSFLKCRINSELKAAFVEQAQKENMNLSAWIVSKLTASLKK